MLLASQTINAGRIARRNGLPLEANPHEPMDKADQYEEQGVPPNNWVARGWREGSGLWETGWRIERLIGERATG